MRIKQLFILIIFSVLLTSCFEEDQAVPPYVPPFDVESLSLQKSIYYNQLYFDFSTGLSTAEIENSEWALGFACRDSINMLRLNTSDFWGAAPTGSSNFDSVYTDANEFSWKSDKSDGNPDSTAISNWISYEKGYPAFTEEVFLIGQYDGISYLPTKKIQLIYADELLYKFRIANLDVIGSDTITINKDQSVNSIQYSFTDESVVQIEPDKQDWDLVFCQYFTILYTDDSIRAPYYVRGALLNPHKVEAALDTLSPFEDIDFDYAFQLDFSNKLDAIGHDWKSVAIDEASNSAEYKVRPGYTYFIKDAEENIFKIRFKSFLNASGLKGYPSFEYAKLSPG
jgi:hypothetical protein